MQSLQKIALSPEQARFASMVSEYPRLERYWNWQERNCCIDALIKDCGAMSLGERQLALFFLSVWEGCNREFDFVDAAAVLDKKERQLIANWLFDPFWP
ncbi:MAG: hypothetical protein RLY17_1525 [Pseudomonadota bacterium]|jgi:hypothetical protein